MNPKSKIEVSFSNRTILRVIGIIIVVLTTIHFLRNVSHVLELIFIASFMSLALNPAVSWISKQLKLKSRAAATGIAYVVVVIVLGTFVSLVVPPLISQTVDFVRQVPSTLDSLQEGEGAVGKFVTKYHLEENVNGLSQNIQDRTKNLQQPVISTATHIGSAFIALVTVFVLTFMFLVEGPEWLRRYWQLHPKENRDHHKTLAQRMYRIVTGYVNGQVLIAAIAGLFSMVTLLIASTIMNVSINAVALAGIVFLFGLIPLIGNTLAAGVVITVCLFSSVPLAITMLVYFLLYQQIENVTLQPYIQAKNNELTPLLVFAAALLGAGLGGLLGAFVAIPAAGCAKVLFVDYLETRGIGKD